MLTQWLWPWPYSKEYYWPLHVGGYVKLLIAEQCRTWVLGHNVLELRHYNTSEKNSVSRESDEHYELGCIKLTCKYKYSNAFKSFWAKSQASLGTNATRNKHLRLWDPGLDATLIYLKIFMLNYVWSKITICLPWPKYVRGLVVLTYAFEDFWLVRELTQNAHQL